MLLLLRYQGSTSLGGPNNIKQNNISGCEIWKTLFCNNKRSNYNDYNDNDSYHVKRVWKEWIFALDFVKLWFSDVFREYRKRQLAWNGLIFVARYPAVIYLLKVDNRNTRTKCEICSKSTIKIPVRRWRRSGIFIVNFEHISHLVLVFLLLTLNM